jgi:hypothetical protein
VAAAGTPPDATTMVGWMTLVSAACGGLALPVTFATISNGSSNTESD